MILDPPAPPITAYNDPLSLNSRMTGLMDESGRLPGRMKLAGEGTKPKELFALGVEKSSISLFMMMPVSGTMRREPKVRLMVLVEEMARPEASAVEICEVPGL